MLQMMVYGAGTFRIPAADLPESLALVVQGAKPGSRGDVIPSSREGNSLVFEVTGKTSGRWIYAVPVK